MLEAVVMEEEAVYLRLERHLRWQRQDSDLCG